MYLGYQQQRYPRLSGLQAIALRIPHLSASIFCNGTVTTLWLLDCPVVARYRVPWGRFS